MLRLFGFNPIIRNEKITTFRRDEVRSFSKKDHQDIHIERRESDHTNGRIAAGCCVGERSMRDSRRKRESNDPYSVVNVRYRRERGVVVPLVATRASASEDGEMDDG